MPWGKHRGRPLTEIDSSYLVWIVETSNADAALRDQVRTELRRRFGASPAPPPPPPRSSPIGRCPDPKVATSLITAGLRALAQKHHPDHGGDTAVMQRINLVAQWLRGEVPQ